nr:efflux RND transporter periplasmic adaptor subunit [Syntrophomonas palmitatica]
MEATTYELNARLNGVIKTLTIEEGARVKKNQLVAELTRSDLEAQKERDALGVMVAQSKLDDLVSGARSQELQEALLNVEMAEDKSSKAEQDLNRATELRNSGAISQQEWEKIKLDKENLDRQLEIYRARLQLLESGSRPGVISGAQAELERSKAVLKASESMLADLKIYAPASGTIISQNYEPGEYIPLGASLATLADLNDLWLKVYIPTDDLPRIHLNQEVKVSVSGSDQTFYGKVTKIASRGEYTPKTIQTRKERSNVVFAVKISLSNPGSVLKPGMPADVIFEE